MATTLPKVFFKTLILFVLLIGAPTLWGQTVTILSEDFTGIAGNNTSTSGSSTAWTGNANFPESSLSSVYQAGDAIRVGSGSSLGSLESKALDLSVNGGNFSISFDVKGWTTVAGDVKITVTGISGTQTITYVAKMSEAFENKTVNFSGGTANAKVKIELSRRGFIDNVKVFYVSAPVLVPTTTSITPTSAIAGSAGFELTVNGSNFVSGTSKVRWNGIDRATTFVSASQLKAAILASDITTAGTALVSVFNTGNPTASNDQTFTINPNISPTITATPLADFGNLCINNISESKSFTLTGTFLTAGDITIAPLSGFSYSETVNGTYTGTLVLNQTGGSYSKEIFVKFNPVAVQSYNGNISISGGGISSPIIVAAKGAGINTPATITNENTTAITSNSATFNGEISNIGCSAITQSGFEYSLINGFANGSGTTVSGTLTGANFTANAISLIPNTTYYYKAYVINGNGTFYGTQKSFITLNLSAPVATAGTNITAASFTANWNTVAGATGYRLDVSESATFGTSSPGTTITEAFNNIPNTASNYATRTWSGEGNIGWTALKARTDQTITGKAIALKDESGANLVSDVISGGVTNIKFEAKRAFSSSGVLTVKVLSGAGFTTVLNVGTISYAGTASTFDSGVINGITGDYKIQIENNAGGVAVIDNLSFTSAAVHIPSFLSGYDNLAVTGASHEVTGLTGSTIYYYRVRATSPTSTSVNSNTIQVTTAVNVLPSLTVNTLADFGDICVNTISTSKSFTLTGENLTNENITIAPLAGFTYSESVDGTYVETLVLNQAGGSYTKEIFVKFNPIAVQSYIGDISITGGGITAAIIVSAKGAGINTPATITNENSTSITSNSAILNGEISGIGCSTITQAGFEYSLIDGFVNGAGTNVLGTITGSNFTGNSIGLLANTIYYYKAYVTNANGTYYGVQKTFKTLNITAPVATDGTEITATSFTANWNAVAEATGYRLDVSELPLFGTSTAGATTIETFTAVPTALGTSYNTRTWTGDGGIEWSAFKSRSDQVITAGNKAITLQDAAGAYLISNVISGGITHISFQAQQFFAGSNGILTVKVLTGADFTTETIIGTLPYTTTMSTYDSGTITGITGDFKIRIDNNTGARPGIDNLSFTAGESLTPSFVAGYENLAVAGTSQEVTGLTGSTAYYYRVRATNATSTSVNSNIIQVTTAVSTVPALTATVLAEFGNVCINTVSETKIFTLTGEFLTTGDITIAPLAGFTYSETVDGTYAETLVLTQTGGSYTKEIFVKFNPTLAQLYTGDISISGAGVTTAILVVAKGTGVNIPVSIVNENSTAVTRNSVTLNGEVSTTGCSVITQRGFEYSTTDGFANGTGTTVQGNATANTFTTNVTGLLANTTYYYKAFATDATGTVYGEQKSFTTLNIDAPIAIDATTITDVSFIANWNAVTDATAYKLDVSLHPLFGTSSEGVATVETFNNMGTVASDYQTRDWTGDGNIKWKAEKARTDQTITGKAITLQNNATAYLGSDVIPGGLVKLSFDAKGAFSDSGVLTVKVLSGLNFATVTTLGTISYTTTTSSYNNASVSGITGDYKIRIENNGGGRVSIDNLSFTAGSTITPSYVAGYENLAVTGTSQEVTGLTGSTTYYYRVRATNATSTSANSNVIQVTTAVSTIPTLTATTLAEFGNVCINTASETKIFTLTGEFLTVGDITIAPLAGFTYSETVDGTYTETLVLTQTGGSYTKEIFVKFNPTLVQAYTGDISISGAGVTTAILVAAKGTGVNTPATVVNENSTAITSNSATLNAEVSNIGCSAITQSGFEYSTTDGFVNGTGTNSIGTLTASNLTGNATTLLANTTYYYKGYVINASGTFYGEQKSFTTLNITAPVATDGTGITSTSFTAHWNAVTEATGYQLDVSESATFGITTAGVTTVETFTAVPTTLGTSYNTRTWTGDGGIGWSAFKSRSDQVITAGNPAITLQNATGAYLVSDVVSGGLSHINFQVQQFFAGTNGILTVKVLSGASFTTETIIGTVPYTTTLSTYDSGAITGITGSYKIKIENNTGARPAIDNLSFTTTASIIPSYVTGYESLAVTGTSQEVTGLTGNTTYYYRVRATNATSTSANSNVIQVTTAPSTVPAFTATALTGFGDVCINTISEAKSFTVTGEFLIAGDITIAPLAGYTYSETATGIYAPALVLTQAGGSYTKEVFVKFNPTLAQAYTGDISISGAGVTTPITVSTTGTGVNTPATVVNENAVAITNNSATLNAEVSNIGCSAITQSGFEYSTIDGFVNGTGTNVLGTLTGSNFTGNATTLLANTTYYYKGYVINGSGTFYGEQKTFTTLNIDTPIATAATSIDGISFVANWNAVVGATGYRLDVSQSPLFGTTTTGTTTVETFSAVPTTAPTSYNTRTWTGDGGIGWSAFKSRADQVITAANPAITLQNAAGAYLVSDVVSGGLSHISFQVQQFFSGTNGILTVKALTGADFTTETIIGTVPYTTTMSTYDSEAIVGITGDFKIRIDNNTGARPAIDNLSFTTISSLIPSYVTGYENLAVASTSQVVTGLTENTTYYYRVRAENGTFTTGNSNTIEVTTAIVTPTWNGTAWSNVVGPDATLDAIIAGDYNTTTGTIVAQNLTINSGVLTIASGTSITLQQGIHVNGGSVMVENNGSLLQVEGAVNTGNITIKRNSSPMIHSDYTTWSSPVTGQNLLTFSPLTLPTNFLVFNPVLGTNGEYQPTPTTNDFVIGKGYSIFTPDNWSSTAAASYLSSFTGIPNNGTKAIELVHGGEEGKGFNLIGNPYPSPISAQDFITANTATTDGTLYFWTHDNPTTVAASNYATYTTAGGTKTSSDGEIPNGIIQTGQGFFVNSMANNTTAVFENTMRLANTENQFFRTENSLLQTDDVVERNRIWLNLSNTDGAFSQVLVSYMTGATQGVDNGIDGKTFGSVGSTLYTILDNAAYTIQGRSLPFVDSDIVPLGFKAATAGNYTITLDSFDGLFTGGQTIYINDKLTNVVHNIKSGPYTFTSAQGTFENRFEILYDETLGIEEPSTVKNQIIIYKQNDFLNIHSGTAIMANVKIYDTKGSLIYQKENINANTVVIDQLRTERQVIIVKITTREQIVVTRKAVY
ncbi:hypothetical protein [Flavobacterium sp. '19STA2R22 D10 B1']|uniref:hypothetical protein n=1 Tax=Flavobacterium aerium TaxID=3037261 RepID=UPI00278BDD39|nr:hypothetical protein [Flavobacterium sp. '19STA2R22 D10 B1']